MLLFLKKPVKLECSSGFGWSLESRRRHLRPLFLLSQLWVGKSLSSGFFFGVGRTKSTVPKKCRQVFKSYGKARVSRKSWKMKFTVGALLHFFFDKIFDKTKCIKLSMSIPCFIRYTEEQSWAFTVEGPKNTIFPAMPDNFFAAQFPQLSFSSISLFSFPSRELDQLSFPARAENDDDARFAKQAVCCLN